MIPLTRRLKAFGLGTLVFVGIFVVLLFFDYQFEFPKDVIDRLDGYCYDILFRPESSPAKDIVVVDLDTTSRIVNRKFCAELIAGLQRANARVIGFDILFIERREPLGDSSLAYITTHHSTNVVHAYNLTDNESPVQIIESDLIPFALKRNNNPYPVPRQDVCIKAKGVELPYEKLVQASQYMAHIKFQRDNDGSIRRLPLILCFGNYIYLSLSLQMARLFWGIEDDSLELQFDSHLSEENIGNNNIILHANKKVIRQIPVDNFGQALINFVKPESFVYYSIRDVLRLLRNIKNGSDINPFENKLILVVNSKAPEEASIFSALGGESFPNWIIHASVISQFLKEKYITESPLYTIGFTFIIMSCVLFWLIFVEIRFRRLRKNNWLTLVSIGLLLILVSFIMLYNGKWPGVILPGIAVFSSYFASKIFIKKFIFPSPPKYLDFEIHIQEKNKFHYLVDVIKSPAGEAIEGDFRLDLDEFEDIVNHLQSLSADRPEVRKFGTDLFNAIFQDQVKRRYDESVGIIARSGDDRLRIKLRIESPELMTLPWEYLYDPVRRSHLALDKKLSIVRYLLVPKDIEPLEVEPPLKILIVISAPSNCNPLQVEFEKTKIDMSLKKLKWKRQVKIDVIRNVTVENFRDKIPGYHVIHFIGHGGFIERQKEEIGCLIFENEAGFSELVDAEQLSLLVCQTRVRLIILNACETAKTSTFDAFLGVAPALVNAGVPAVVAMQFPMPDPSAVIFSEEFYRSLAQNYQIDAAMTDARIALATKIGMDRIDWGIPVLFMRSPDGVLFRQKL